MERWSRSRRQRQTFSKWKQKTEFQNLFANNQDRIQHLIQYFLMVADFSRFFGERILFLLVGDSIGMKWSIHIVNSILHTSCFIPYGLWFMVSINICEIQWIQNTDAIMLPNYTPYTLFDKQCLCMEEEGVWARYACINKQRAIFTQLSLVSRLFSWLVFEEQIIFVNLVGELVNLAKTNYSTYYPFYHCVTRYVYVWVCVCAYNVI